jgi:Tfp pilus assembly protein PilN
METPLNFAKAPFRNERLPRIAFTVIAVALVAATLWHAVVLTRYLLREAEELDVTVQRMEEQLSGLVTDINQTRAALNEERSDSMSQRVSFLADVYQRKGFSWTGLFNQLESILPPNVRITSISPSAAQGEIEVRLTTVGRSLEDLLLLVRTLEESRYFGTVMPLDEAHQQEEGTVSSTVTLRYLAEENEPSTQAGTGSRDAPRARGRGRAPRGLDNLDEPDDSDEPGDLDAPGDHDDGSLVDDEDADDLDDITEDNQ